MTSIDLGRPGDFHVHLRDGAMMELVTPTVRQGGVSVCFVMPNLVPPLTEPARVKAYQAELERLAPRTRFLMSLYLTTEVTPEVVVEAKKQGITGVKCYPAGVTTNSQSGVSSYEVLYPTFAEMERQDMVLNLHGECPSGEDITVMNAEEKFLPTLEKLHQAFPKLRIVLEHCTSAAAVEAVKRCGPTVAATITAHHLYLTVDSWGGNSFNFCKPVAKHPADRRALLEAATSGDPKFFFGSDSAPHPVQKKLCGHGAAAGVYTQSHALGYVAQAFEKLGRLDALRGFVTEHGSRFYQLEQASLDASTVRLVRRAEQVPEELDDGKDIRLVPLLAGETLNWSVEWSD